MKRLRINIEQDVGGVDPRKRTAEENGNVCGHERQSWKTSCVLNREKKKRAEKERRVEVHGVEGKEGSDEGDGRRFPEKEETNSAVTVEDTGACKDGTRVVGLR